MAIGTTAAIIGSAVVGAGANALSASSNNRAVNRATDANTQANRDALAAQERARVENLGLQRPLYDAGMPAINARNALLGLQQPVAQPQPNVLSQFQGYNPDSTARTFGTGERGYSILGDRPLGNFAAPGGITGEAPVGSMVTTQATNALNPQQTANNAFDTFRGSTGYQFRVNEGNRALNAGWAGAGTLQSGAAMRAAQEFGQNIASAEFGNYMGYLGEQQNLASGAANAMSGVNTTYANNAGNLAVAQGQNLANAAVARSNNNNALIAGVGNALGTGLGAFAFPRG